MLVTSAAGRQAGYLVVLILLLALMLALRPSHLSPSRGCRNASISLCSLFSYQVGWNPANCLVLPVRAVRDMLCDVACHLHHDLMRPLMQREVLLQTNIMRFCASAQLLLLLQGHSEVPRRRSQGLLAQRGLLTEAWQAARRESNICNSLVQSAWHATLPTNHRAHHTGIPLRREQQQQQQQ
jgi:hypothetical protein